MLLYYNIIAQVDREGFFFYTLFIEVIQYHDIKHVFLIAQMLALGFDWGSGETILQEKISTGQRWDSNLGPCS